MAANKCCPANYIYVDLNGTYIDPTTGNVTSVLNWLATSHNPLTPCYTVQSQTAYGAAMATINCPCCPANYTIANSLGWISTDGGVLLIGTNAANLCVSLADFTTTISPLGSCPCCPIGYAYNSSVDLCFPTQGGSTGILKGGIPTIPCVPCTGCLAPPSPPPCATCGNTALPISFLLDTISKVCTDCPPQDQLSIHDPRLIKFMPNLLLDPLVNFILRQ